MNLVFSPSVLGATDCSAWVSGNEVDPVAANNASGASISVVPQPEISIIEKSLREGQMRSANMAVTVQLSAPSSETVAVDFNTADGSALANTDYLPKTGTLLFPPGITTKTVSVGVIGNGIEEPDKFFYLVLRNPSGAFLGANETMALIVNDDIETPLVITLVALDEQGLHLRFPATAGRQYLFERSLDLYPGAWTILETWTAPTDGLIEVVDPEAAALPQAYYRIRRME